MNEMNRIWICWAVSLFHYFTRKSIFIIKKMIDDWYSAIIDVISDPIFKFSNANILDLNIHCWNICYMVITQSLKHSWRRRLTSLAGLFIVNEVILSQYPLLLDIFCFFYLFHSHTIVHKWILFILNVSLLLFVFFSDFETKHWCVQGLFPWWFVQSWLGTYGWIEKIIPNPIIAGNLLI